MQTIVSSSSGLHLNYSSNNSITADIIVLHHLQISLLPRLIYRPVLSTVTIYSVAFSKALDLFLGAIRRLSGDQFIQSYPILLALKSHLWLELDY